MKLEKNVWSCSPKIQYMIIQLISEKLVALFENIRIPIKVNYFLIFKCFLDNYSFLKLILLMNYYAKY